MITAKLLSNGVIAKEGTLVDASFYLNQDNADIKKGAILERIKIN